MKLAISFELLLLYAIAYASALTCGNIGDDISIKPGKLKEIFIYETTKTQRRNH